MIISTGADLARARERLGISVEELSTRAGIPVDIATAIEHGHPDELFAVGRLDHYVRTFATAVGLDAEHTSDQYRAQLSAWSPWDEFESEEKADQFSSAYSLEDFPPEESAPPIPTPIASTPSPRASLFQSAVMTLLLLATAFSVFALRTSTRSAGSGAATTPSPPQAQASNATDSAREAQSVPARDVTERRQQTRETPARRADQAPTGPLTGLWMVTNHVERSRLDSFDDLTLGFRLRLAQTGNRVRGEGFKWTENGRPIPSRGRSPIKVDGTLEDGRLALTFTEHGSRRVSHGNFEMQLADDGSLRGHFVSDAAQSSGSAHAVRMAQPN